MSKKNNNKSASNENKQLSATEQLAQLTAQIEALKVQAIEETKAKRAAMAEKITELCQELDIDLATLSNVARAMAKNNGELPEGASGLPQSLSSLNGGTKYGKGSRIPEEVYAQIDEKLKTGAPVSAIALETGVSVPTINLRKKELGLVKARVADATA